MESGLTLVDLAVFTGKPTNYYDRFVAEAIEQAEDLLELATGVDIMPDVSTKIIYRVTKRGILAMAEALYEGQNTRDMRFSPYRSETIGSYSYSIASGQISEGVPTGIGWFDLATTQLREDPVAVSSIHVFDRPGDIKTVNGEEYLIGPADVENFRGSPSVYRHPLLGQWQPSLVDEPEGYLP